MQVWVDAQLSPALASWLRSSFDVDAWAVRELGLRDAEDTTIFARATDVRAVVLTKDHHFVELLSRHGAPPQIVWLTCGNTSNAFLHAILTELWPRVASLLADGEPLVEIGGRII